MTIKAAQKSEAKKKEKDPNAPKKPQSSYFLFMNIRRGPLKDEQPNLKLGEVTKVLTDEWKKMPEAEKQKYEDMATRDRERYKKEMIAAGLAKPEKEKDENAPKKA